MVSESTGFSLLPVTVLRDPRLVFQGAILVFATWPYASLRLQF
jgi:hypothetical protein